MWNEGNVEQSNLIPKLGLIELRKAINILKFVVRNETIEEVKDAYEEKLR